MIKTAVVWAIAIFSTVLASVGTMASPSPVATTDIGDIHWSYESDAGPEHWSELDPSFALCNSGSGQSPINLTAAVSTDLINPEFHSHSVPLNLLNNGHTVQVPYAPGSYIVIDGDRYNLLQFHFHSPSEHTVDTKPWDAELHLVHQNDAGNLAVVAVLMQTGNMQTGNMQTDNTSSRTYKSISLNLPAASDDKVRTETTINAQDLLPKTTKTYRYAGSLTTPPCSEDVIWLVMTEPTELSAEDIERYKKVLRHNNRPSQTLNERVIQIDASL